MRRERQSNHFYCLLSDNSGAWFSIAAFIRNVEFTCHLGDGPEKPSGEFEYKQHRVADGSPHD